MLQIYDRVIPNQSESTLWVLTLGALLAIAFDGALRIARAALMDNTGRKIELSVQDRLMQRLLGMRAAPGERQPSQVFGAMRDFGSVREFFTASTIARPSAMVRVRGFSQYTSFPAWQAFTVCSACQWSGVVINTASTSLRSSSLR